MMDEKWITISDDRYEGIYNIRTRGMAIPGGMIVETIITDVHRAVLHAPAISSVFVPDDGRLDADMSTWLATQELTNNIHGV
jgi:hypothetical protein